LKALAALGASLALPALAIESATRKDIDAAWLELQSSNHHGLDDHPRIVLLRSEVKGLPVDEEYKKELLHSIELYRDQILERPEYSADEGWDDLEALQQVTLGDMNERWFKEQGVIAAQEELKRIEASKTQVRDFIERKCIVNADGKVTMPHDYVVSIAELEAPSDPEVAAQVIAVWVQHPAKPIKEKGDDYKEIAFLQWATKNSREEPFSILKNRFPDEWRELATWMEEQESAINERVNNGFFGSPAQLGEYRRRAAGYKAKFLGDAIRLGGAH
jgi:hypothetical protein